MQLLDLKVLGINGGYTRNGTTGQMLRETLAACETYRDHEMRVRVSSELINLVEVIQGFTVPAPHSTPRHLEPMLEKVRTADIIVFATPVLWSMPTPLMTQFFVDSTALESDQEFPLRGKVAGVIAHCDEDGGEKVVSDLMVPLRHFGFALPPHAGFWRNRHGCDRSENAWQLDNHVRVLAHNLVALAASLKRAPGAWR